jgi:hypothetical protein
MLGPVDQAPPTRPGPAQTWSLPFTCSEIPLALGGHGFPAQGWAGEECSASSLALGDGRHWAGATQIQRPRAGGRCLPCLRGRRGAGGLEPGGASALVFASSSATGCP